MCELRFLVFSDTSSECGMCIAIMSYQEREVTLSDPSNPTSEEDVLVTALHWSGAKDGGSPNLLIVGYMHHGIRYVFKCYV